MRRSGFTLVELLLALGLLAVLMIALVRLLDTSLRIWGRTEANRDLLEMGGAVLDLCAGDLGALEGGPRGDLLAEWVRFDTDRDGSRGAVWPRLRIVRRASASGLQGARPGSQARTGGLFEVCWALLPASQATPDERPLGVLWRGERWVGDEETLSFFDPRFFDAANKPVPGGLNAVTGGMLWFEPWFAAQTSVVRDGWSLGEELADCAASWDAWNAERPDPELSWLNLPAAGMPPARDRPLLPRRVRISIEIERPEELKRRTRLAADLAPDHGRILVADETRLPAEGAMILIDEEWMRLGAVSGGAAAVERARRGTRRAPHKQGARIHHGARLVREIPIRTMSEDWDL